MSHIMQTLPVQGERRAAPAFLYFPRPDSGDGTCAIAPDRWSAPSHCSCLQAAEVLRRSRELEREYKMYVVYNFEDTMLFLFVCCGSWSERQGVNRNAYRGALGLTHCCYWRTNICGDIYVWKKFTCIVFIQLACFYNVNKCIINYSQ